MGGIVFSRLYTWARNETLIRWFMFFVKPQPWPSLDGVKYPSFIPFRSKGINNHMKEVMELDSRDNDILITTYVKSGTHWIFEIVSILVHKSKDLSDISKVETMLDSLPTVQLLEQVPEPRIINTHFSYRYLPKAHIQKKNKTIHFIRNPKDVCVSYFHHAQKDIFINIQESWDDFFQMWIDWELPYETWYKYELDFERASKDNPESILILYFEDMVQDPSVQIKRLAEFLNIECSDEQIKRTIELTSFDNMKEKKKDATSFISGDGQGFIFRKGKVGDWRNYFTVSQNEGFDAQYRQEMKNSKLEFKFSL